MPGRTLAAQPAESATSSGGSRQGQWLFQHRPPYITGPHRPRLHSLWQEALCMGRPQSTSPHQWMGSSTTLSHVQHRKASDGGGDGGGGQVPRLPGVRSRCVVVTIAPPWLRSGSGAAGRWGCPPCSESCVGTPLSQNGYGVSVCPCLSVCLSICLSVCLSVWSGLTD